MIVTMRHSVTNMPDTLTHTDAQTHTMHHARVYSSTSIVGINNHSYNKSCTHAALLILYLLIAFCTARPVLPPMMAPICSSWPKKGIFSLPKWWLSVKRECQSKERLRLCLDSNCHCFGGCKQCGGRASANRGTTAQDKSASNASGRASASATATGGRSSNMGVEHMRCLSKTVHLPTHTPLPAA